MFFLFILPCVFGILLAGAFARALSRKLSGGLTIVLSGLLGGLFPILYLAIWQEIEAAQRRAMNDNEPFMGPLVALVYGFPIFGFSAVMSFAVAVFFAMRRK